MVVVELDLLDVRPGGPLVAPEAGRIFTSNGATDEVGVFDLRTGRLLRTVKVGRHPDAIAYDPATRRVFAFNGHSNDVTAIDARTLQVLAASIPAGGSPEYAVSDGKGHVFFNVEDKSELAVLDARSLTVVRRFSLAPCEEPSGLAIDPRERLYSVCRNKLMVISDPATRALPALARAAIKPNGQIDLATVLRGIARNPRTLRALVSTGIDFSRALRSLRGCRGFLLGSEGFLTADF